MRTSLYTCRHCYISCDWYRYYMKRYSIEYTLYDLLRNLLSVLTCTDITSYADSVSVLRAIIIVVTIVCGVWHTVYDTLIIAIATCCCKSNSVPVATIIASNGSCRKYDWSTYVLYLLKMNFIITTWHVFWNCFGPLLTIHIYIKHKYTHTHIHTLCASFSLRFMLLVYVTSGSKKLNGIFYDLRNQQL